MDMPGLRQPPKKKRDPEKDKKNQKLYRQRQYAALNGIEDVKAVHRRRYHERMARMRANGEYEAFKAKKTQEGMRRYHAMTEERGQTQKRPVSKKLGAKNEGQGDLRGLQTAIECAAARDTGREKNERWASRGGRPCRVRDTSSGWNRFGVENGNGWTRNWSVPFPYRGCP